MPLTHHGGAVRDKIVETGGQAQLQSQSERCEGCLPHYIMIISSLPEIEYWDCAAHARGKWPKDNQQHACTLAKLFL